MSHRFFIYEIFYYLQYFSGRSSPSTPVGNSQKSVHYLCWPSSWLDSSTSRIQDFFCNNTGWVNESTLMPSEKHLCGKEQQHCFLEPRSSFHWRSGLACTGTATLKLKLSLLSYNFTSLFHPPWFPWQKGYFAIRCTSFV